MEPKVRGIGRGVHVYDFKSLYPSVMVSFNMSPETKRLDVLVNGPIPEGCCRTPNGVAFDLSKVGILVEALLEVLALRDKWKKAKKDHPPGTPGWNYANQMSTAYKVIANGFYGVLSSIWSRFYDPVIGEAITQTAKWLNVRTLEAAENDYFRARGIACRAVYADTDSGYLMGPTEEQMVGFREWCNSELYPRLLREQGCRTNTISIAYEKEYRRIVFNGSAKKLGKLCAKQYCGSYAHYEGKRATEESEPEVKGLACVRGDATRLAARLQKEAIDLLVGGLRLAKDGPVPTDDLARYRALIERHRALVLDGPLPIEDVEKSQGLDKPLRDYAERKRADGATSFPAHVEVAKILQQRGREVREGTRIAYVVADGSVSPMKVIPAEDYTGVEADRWYLWENLVYPATRHLLEGAFPPVDERGRPNVEHDWGRFARVRPKPDKSVLAGQMGLLGGDTWVSPRVASRRGEVRATLGLDDRALFRLEVAARALPGSDRIDLVAMDGGAQVAVSSHCVDLVALERAAAFREACASGVARYYAA
jgi:DNA polymerase, archaea type